MLINYRIVHFGYFLLLKVGSFWELYIILAYKDIHWIRKLALFFSFSFGCLPFVSCLQCARIWANTLHTISILCLWDNYQYHHSMHDYTEARRELPKTSFKITVCTPAIYTHTDTHTYTHFCDPLWPVVSHPHSMYHVLTCFRIYSFV